MVVGEAHDLGVTWFRAYLRFDVTSIPDSVYITSVKLWLYYDYYGWSSDHEGEAKLYRINDIGNSLDASDWSLSELADYGTVVGPGQGSYGWKSTAVTSSVTPTSTFVSYRLKSTIEDWDYPVSRWHFDTTETTNDPYLEVTYVHYPTNDSFELNLAGASYKGTKTLLTGKQDYKFVAKVTDNDGYWTIDYVTIALDPTGKNVILKANCLWDGEDFDVAFSEQSDPSNYVTLNAGGSSFSTTAYQVTLNFLVKLNWNWDDSAETIAVQMYSYDTSSLSDTDNYSSVFGVENDLSSSSLAVSDYRVNPGQALTMSGYWYYQGTSIYPPDGNYQVRIKLSGIQKGTTDTTLENGAFSIGINAESTVGSYSYEVEASYMTSSGTFSAVIVDKINVIIAANSTTLVKSQAVQLTTSAKFQYDNSDVTTLSFQLTRNGSNFATSSPVTDGPYANKIYVYTISSASETTYGLSAFSSNTVTVTWTAWGDSPTIDSLTLDLTGASYKGAKTLLTSKQDYKFILKVTDSDGVTDLHYCEIRLDFGGKNVVLRVTKGTGDTWTFSEQSDPSNYVTLNIGASSHSTSGNQKTFNFLVKINWNWNDATETLVVQAYSKDQDDLTDTDNFSSVFGVENDLASSSLAVSDSNRVNPSQALTMSGYWYYEGTSIYPPNGDYQVKIKLSGVQVGSTDTTLVNGQFSIDISAESTVASYGYTVEATYMTSSGSFSSVIVDRLEIFWYSTSDSRADISTNVDYRWKLRYDYDDTVFDNTKGTVSIGGTSATWDGGNSWWFRTVGLPSSPQAYPQGLTFSDTTHGLTTIAGTTSQSVIADRFEIISITVDDTRINVDGTFELRYQIRYDFDDVTFTSSKGTVSGFTWDATDNRWEKIVTGSSSVSSTNYDETYVSISDTTYGLTTKQDVGGVDVITDRIEIYYQAVDDSRVNIGSNIEFRVKARLDYDDHELGSGDSLSSNFGALSWDASNLWFDGLRSQSSTGSFSFSTVSGSESTYGITTVYLGVSNVLGVYDRILVTISANATNPSVGDTVQFTLSAKYEYDNTDVTTLSFQVTRNGSNYATSTPFTDMQTGELVFNYTTSSASETTYGLTAFSTNTVTVQWGGLFIEAWEIIVDDFHADCDSNVYLRWRLRYSANQSAVPSGTIWINGTSHSITSGWANFTVTLSSVGIRVYTQTDINVDGEHDYGQIPSNPTIIWDRIKITQGGVSDARCNYGSTQTVWFKAVYEYNSATFNNGAGALYVNGSAMTWSSTNLRWEKTYAYSSIVKYAFQISSVLDTNYGLTSINNVAGAKEIVWDRIKITDGGVIDSRVDYGTAAKVWFEASWEYDSVAFQAGSGIIYVNSTAAVWNPTYTRWELEITYFAVTNYSFKVSSILDNTYGISVLNDLAGAKWVIWDRLKCVSVTANDTRIDVGGLFELRYQIQYEYGSVAFTNAQGSVSGFTWDSGNSYWKKNVVGSSSVTSTNYDENYISITDSTYGLTVKTDVSGVNIITDRFEIYYVSVSSDHINIGDSFELRCRVRYDYDKVIFTSSYGSISGFTWDASNFWWKKQTAGSLEPTSTKYDEAYVLIVDSTFGLETKKDITGVNVITDGLKISEAQVDLVLSKLELRLVYAYNNAAIYGGNITFAGYSALTNSSGRASFNLNSFSDFPWGLPAYGLQDNAYGITFKFQNQSVPLEKLGSILIETESGLTVSSSNYQNSQLTLIVSGSGIKYVRLKGPKPYYVKVGTETCLEGNKWNYNTAGYAEITDSYSTKTLFASWTPLDTSSTSGSGSDSSFKKPKTIQEEITESISTALFMLSSNYVGTIIFVLTLVAFLLSFYYERKVLATIIGAVMVYLLFDLLVVFVLIPQQLFPSELMVLEPFLWTPPPVALEMFGGLGMQQLIQLLMMGSLFTILAAAIYGVSHR